jgi:hypothetical protein
MSGGIINSNRMLLLAKLESTAGTDSLPVPSADAFLVSDVDVSIETNPLDRNVVRPTFSKEASVIARKTATFKFSHEIKNSGSSAAPKLARLLRACGFQQTTIGTSAAATIQALTANVANTSPTLTMTKTTAGTKTATYTVTVAKGGASATAKLRVSAKEPFGNTGLLLNETFSGAVTRNVSGTATGTITQGLTTASDTTSITYTIGGTVQAGDVFEAIVGGISFFYEVPASGVTTVDEVATALAAIIDADARCIASASTSVITVTFAGQANPTTVTSGSTALTLGQSGAVVSFTWTGNLVFGDTWEIQVLEPGIHLTPVSDAFETITLYCYYENRFHKLTYGVGSVSFNMESNNYGMATFNFSGQYNDITDTGTLPTGAIFEQSMPVQIERANFRLNGIGGCAKAISIDMANTLSVRECINGADGFDGFRITDRNPTGSADPESVARATHNVFRLLSTGAISPFHIQVGQSVNNYVKFVSESCQYQSHNYGDRDNILVDEISLKFVAKNDTGDNEIRIIFN